MAENTIDEYRRIVIECDNDTGIKPDGFIAPLSHHRLLTNSGKFRSAWSNGVISMDSKTHQLHVFNIPVVICSAAKEVEPYFKIHSLKNREFLKRLDAS